MASEGGAAVFPGSSDSAAAVGGEKVVGEAFRESPNLP